MKKPIECILVKLLKSLFIFAFFLTLTGATRQGTPLAKKEAISFLKSYAESNRKKLQQIDKRLREVLMNTYNTDLSPSTDDASQRLVAREIEVLTLKRKEHKLREDFVDRLVFNIDRKYSGGDWRAFLAQQVIEMASIEATSMSSDVGLVKFCGFLSAAIRRIPERSEDVFSFIEGYIEFSTLLDPRPASEYVKHRSYTNGTTTVFKEGVPKEDIGEIVENRLARLSYLKSLQRKSFEERAPVLKPVSLTSEVLIKPIEVEPTKPSASINTGQLRVMTKPSENEPSTEAHQGVPTSSAPENTAIPNLRIKMHTIHNEATDSQPVESEPKTSTDAAYE